jgi:hypothetical protein
MICCGGAFMAIAFASSGFFNRWYITAGPFSASKTAYRQSCGRLPAPERCGSPVQIPSRLRTRIEVGVGFFELVEFGLVLDDVFIGRTRSRFAIDALAFGLCVSAITRFAAASLLFAHFA